jgi:hypothetical protein
MLWTGRHDDYLIREMLLFEPWQLRKGTPERGNVWKAIAESLNQITDPMYKVEDRSVRDRYKLLEKKYIRRRNELEKASGVEVPEESETEKGLGDIIQLFKDSEMQHNVEKDKKKEALENETKQAEEMRMVSMETMGESKTRKLENGEESGNSKRRRSSDETITYLREKNKMNMNLGSRKWS